MKVVKKIYSTISANLKKISFNLATKISQRKILQGLVRVGRTVILCQTAPVVSPPKCSYIKDLLVESNISSTKIQLIK